MSTTTDAPTFELRHRLALALEHGDISISDMAIELECAETTIRNYLAGRTVPKKVAIKAWAERCGVPFDWLYQGVGATGWLHRAQLVA